MRKLHSKFDELDKLHAELDELHKLNYKFVKFDKFNSKLDELDKAAEMRYFYLSNICKHVANTKMRPRLQVSNINIIFMFANVCADFIQIYFRSIFAVV